MLLIIRLALSHVHTCIGKNGEIDVKFYRRQCIFFEMFQHEERLHKERDAARRKHEREEDERRKEAARRKLEEERRRREHKVSLF